MAATTRRFPCHLLTLSLLGIVTLGLPTVAGAQKSIIVQTNAAGDNVHLIDPVSNTIVGEISGI